VQSCVRPAAWAPRGGGGVEDVWWLCWRWPQRASAYLAYCAAAGGLRGGPPRVSSRCGDLACNEVVDRMLAGVAGAEPARGWEWWRPAPTPPTAPRRGWAVGVKGVRAAWGAFWSCGVRIVGWRWPARRGWGALCGAAGWLLCWTVSPSGACGVALGWGNYCNVSRMGGWVWAASVLEGGGRL
jgi:hypothetical protein